MLLELSSSSAPSARTRRREEDLTEVCDDIANVTTGMAAPEHEYNLWIYVEYSIRVTDCARRVGIRVVYCAENQKVYWEDGWTGRYRYPSVPLSLLSASGQCHQPLGSISPTNLGVKLFQPCSLKRTPLLHIISFYFIHLLIYLFICLFIYFWTRIFVVCLFYFI